MRLERLAPLINSEALQRLQDANIAIVGLGGVGGIAAIALARSGIGHLILCDFDVVEESNINRQIVASMSTLGRLKTDVLKEMIHDINPSCSVIVLSQKVNDQLFSHQPSHVIDAIDDINAKISLIESCLKYHIPFISSMGAGKKMDLSKVKVTKLKKTTHDPVAKVMRSHFKNIDFDVVSSDEEVKCQALGSYMPVVSTFGLYLSDYIIQMIIRS